MPPWPRTIIATLLLSQAGPEPMHLARPQHTAAAALTPEEPDTSEPFAFHPDAAHLFVAKNPDQGFSMVFNSSGFEVNRDVQGGRVHSSFTLVHLGKKHGPSLASDRSGLHTDGTRAIVDHASYQVEYLNSPKGIRQNFIVQQEPDGQGILEAHLRITGDLRPIAGGGDLILLVDSNGSTILHYHDLHVWDARGDTLEASATVRDELIVLALQDANAVVLSDGTGRMLGMHALDGASNKADVSLGHLAAGSYVLQLLNERSALVAVGRVVRE